MAIDLTSVEDASRAMYIALNKGAVGCHATYASGNTDEYYRYIVLTQRVTVADTLVGYITYRLTRTTKTSVARFSSYEIFDANFDQNTAKKFKLVNYPDALTCFKVVCGCVLTDLIKGGK